MILTAAGRAALEAGTSQQRLCPQPGKSLKDDCLGLYRTGGEMRALLERGQGLWNKGRPRRRPFASPGESWRSEAERENPLTSDSSTFNLQPSI
jgi:hypothetical protein